MCVCASWNVSITQKRWLSAHFTRIKGKTTNLITFYWWTNRPSHASCFFSGPLRLCWYLHLLHQKLRVSLMWHVFSKRYIIYRHINGLLLMIWGPVRKKMWIQGKSNYMTLNWIMLLISHDNENQHKRSLMRLGRALFRRIMKKMMMFIPFYYTEYSSDTFI